MSDQAEVPMVEVPLADGKKTKVPLHCIVRVKHPNSGVASVPVIVGEGGFYYSYETTASLIPWNPWYVTRVYEEVDLPDPIVELPQGIGAVLRSENNPTWYLVRLDVDTWMDDARTTYSNNVASYLLTFPRIYVVSEGVEVS